MPSPIIDAHHHFWDPNNGDYDWISGDFQPIRRVFAPADLRPSLQHEGVSGTVLVQTWHSLRESHDFLEIAANTDFIAGVVAWIDLTDRHVADRLHELKSGPNGRWLVGIRHLLHLEADPEWILRDDVRRGLAAVADAGLVYDLVGNTAHLRAMLQTVADFPQLRFVLDHIAKPDIKAGVREPWGSLIRSFAPYRDHVWCKLSGMITEADWENWSAGDLQPYVDEVLQIFTPERLIFGTDWPVCLVAGSYADVVDVLRICLDVLSVVEHDKVFGRNAIEAYRLPEFVT